ncbi:MAG: TylF/MycF/NovP-related O-methyltransferase [Gemmatimonas sp.]
MIRSLFHRSRDRALSLSLSTLARDVSRQHLTTLTPQKLLNLEQTFRMIDRKGVAGDVVECGVGAGGSAALLASLCVPERRFVGYDSFRDPPLDTVTATLRSFGIDLDGARVALRHTHGDDAPQLESGRRIALLHINCEWPWGARCLDALGWRVVPGGAIVLDDRNEPSLCSAAVSRFLGRERDFAAIPGKGSTVIGRNG